jgi:hypothetical protein
MSKNIQINVEDPCHQDWAKMAPEEKGRFCCSCSKTVVDFSPMSDRELLSSLANAGAHVCGRFTADQLNRNLMPLPVKRSGWWGAWNVVLMGLLLSSRAEAQTKPTKPGTLQGNKKKIVVERQPMMQGMISIYVPDQARIFSVAGVIDSVTHLPVANATIRIGAGIESLAADSTGRFRLTNKMVSEASFMEVSSVGYTTRNIALDKDLVGQKDLTISLSPQVLGLPPVEVTAGPVVGELRIMVGGMRTVGVMVRDYTDLLGTIKQLAADSLGLLGMAPREMAVYPNPAQRGSVIQVSLRLDSPGAYRLGLFNAAGSLMQAKAIDLAEKAHLELLNIPGSLAAGIYFVQLSGPRLKKTITQKVVVK